MNNHIDWVYNHVDPDFITTVILVIGVGLMLYAIILHSENNDKRFSMALSIALLVFAGYNTSNLKWHNLFNSYERRAGMSKVVYVKGDLYMIEDSSSARITLNRVDLYDPSYAKRYEATYGCVGTADNLLDEVTAINDNSDGVFSLTPKPKEVNLDCSTPK